MAEKARSVCNEYYEVSTIHGIGHYGRSSSVWKAFWLLVIIICFVAMITQLVLLVLKYLSYEKRLNLDLRFEENPFPAVSVCSLNPYKNSEAQKVQSIATLLQTFDAAMLASKDRAPKAAPAAAAESTRPPGKHTICMCLDGECTEMSQEADSHDFLESTNVQECLCWDSDSDQACEACNPTSGCGVRKKRQSGYNTRVTVCDCLEKCTSELNFAGRIDFSNQLNTCICAEKDGVEEFCQKCEDVSNCEIIFPTSATTTTRRPTTTTRKKKTTTTTRSTTTTITSTTTSTTTTTTTTTKPILTLAENNDYGFEAGSDSIAVQAVAQESLPYLAADLDTQTKDKITVTAAELIKNCAFNAKSCDIDKDFEKTLDPKYGSCFTFNHRYPAKFVSSRAGPLYGLRLVLFSNTSDYMRTTETAGARIVIHDQDSHSYPDAFGFNAPTATSSAFAVRPFRNKRIEPPYGKCRNDTSKLLHFYPGKYTIEGCTRSCHQREILNRCGCGDPRFELPNDLQVQDLHLNFSGNQSNDNITLIDELKQTLSDEKTNVSQLSHCKSSDPEAKRCISYFTGESLQKVNCDCPMPCEENTYLITVSASKWPYSIEQVPGCGKDASLKQEECSQIQESGIMIEIFYEQLSYEYRWETAAYSEINLFSDMAGQIGFWVGISMISIIEVVVTFCRCIFCCGCFCSKKTQNEVDEFPLTSVKVNNIQRTKSAFSRKSTIRVNPSGNSAKNLINVTTRLPPI